ncbi:MAG: tRNA pseudouridine(13) synthase TruD, partial [Methanomicrobiales archaeon]|nr:tRNA pseudouridine(13) synthase TruD [Methanomicrobiales archaeon]
ILFGDYEGAVLTYVGRSFPDESESARLAREEFHRTRDAGAALRNFPLHLAYERSILHHLVTDPTGFREALAVLPPKLLSMFVSAYQSYLFNSALSARCREGTPLTTPVEGDVLVFSDGRTDRVTPRLLPAARLQLERRRACLGLFIPGSRPEDWKTASPKACEILAERGIASDNFRKASEFTGTAFQGFHRVIGLSTDIMSKIEGNDVHLGFTLLPGQYATTVCREFMKTDPLTLI